jgi:hypothetical protein
MKMFLHLWQYHTDFFLEWEMFQIKVVEKIETRILFSITLRKSCRLWDIIKKYGGAREDAENIVPACGILDK